MRVILLLRLMQKTPAWQSQLWRRLLLCHGCDIARRSVIGPGLRMPRAYGIALGANTVLGRDVTVHQNVSISPADKDWRQPPGLARVGDGVEVRAGSVILGDLEIGAGAVVGPLSVLNRSVPPRTTFCNAPTVHPALLKPCTPPLATEPSPWTRTATWLAKQATTGPVPLASLAQGFLLSWFQTSVDSTTSISPGALENPRWVTIQRADIRDGARLGSRVTIENPDRNRMAVVGAGSCVESGAVLVGPVTVPPGTVVPANHLLCGSVEPDELRPAAKNGDEHGSP